MKTWSSVTNWLVRDGEFTQIVSNHISLNFNLSKRLSVVNSNKTSNHLWNNDHVTKVSLYKSWLLWCNNSNLCLSELLNQTHWLALQSTLESSTCTGVNQFYKLKLVKFYLFSWKVQQLFQINSSVGKFLVGFLCSCQCCCFFINVCLSN